MSATVEAPVDLVESVAHLRLPPQEDRRLQELIDANTNGSLTAAEREQLTSLVEWSESLSLVVAGNGQVQQESIMVALSSEVEEVVEQIRLWPAETRIVLARRVLETLDTGSTISNAGFKGPPAEQVLGLWNPSGTAPTDEECDRILADELRRKHAS